MRLKSSRPISASRALDAVADGALGAMQLGSGFGEAQVPRCNRKDVQRIERGKASHFALRMQCRDA